MKKFPQWLTIVWLFIAFSSHSFSSESNAVYPLAIFDFVEKGNELSGLGEKIKDKLMIVSKIIGTETSRVVGASVKGGINDSVVTLAESLSTKIAETVAANADSLVAKPVTRIDHIAMLKKKLSKVKKPSLSISIQERHINQHTEDPAAETEMIMYSTEAGFVVIDDESDKVSRADILITGEGFTEFATRKGDIVGVKARLEVKAVDQATKQVIAIDRQTELEVDLSEIVAAKKALERASAKIAIRILPKITARYQ